MAEMHVLLYVSIVDGWLNQTRDAETCIQTLVHGKYVRL